MTQTERMCLRPEGKRIRRLKLLKFKLVTTSIEVGASVLPAEPYFHTVRLKILTVVSPHFCQFLHKNRNNSVFCVYIFGNYITNTYFGHLSNIFRTICEKRHAPLRFVVFKSRSFRSQMSTL